MINFYQNLPSLIDPVVFSFGDLSVRWYSLSYLVAFLTVYLLLRYRLRKDPLDKEVKKVDLDLLLFFSIVGMMIGARLGYVLFYGLSDFIQNPLTIIWPYSDGAYVGLFGLSFHGGLIGAVLGAVGYARQTKISFWKIADFLVPAIPLSYFFGRIGNFLNGELYGRATDFFLGMNFPSAPGRGLRHPSQLYEALGEGLIIFFILWPLRNHPKLRGNFLAIYLILYGIVRFLIEFVRQPDPHLGFIFLGLTMGQILCLGMMIAGGSILKIKSKI